MNLQDIMQNQNIIIAVSTADLLKFSEQLLSGAKEIYEKEREQDRYLTRNEAAQTLCVDISTLWRWNKEKYLQSVHIGGKIRYKL